MPYLQKRNDVFYLRVKIPVDLSQWFPLKQDLRKSLRTKERKCAKMILAKHLERTERTFALMRSDLLNETQIRKLAEDYLRDTLAENDRDRLENGAKAYFDDESGHWQTTVPYHDLVEEPARVLAGETSVEMERILNSFLEDKGITVESASLDYKRLLREISRVHLESLRIDERRDLGDLSDQYYLKHEEPSTQVQLESQPESPAAQLHKPSSQEQPKSILLSELIDLFTTEKVALGKWTKKTQGEQTTGLNLFVRLLGDVDVKTLKRTTMVECLNKVKQLTVGNKPISVLTVKKHMVNISSLFGWAVRNEYMVRNPAEGLAPTSDKADNDHRIPYEQEDLKKLMSVLCEYRKESRVDRWMIPLIGLYSGLRIDEICQLHKEDVKQIEGVWCFNANRDDDRKLKTKTSIRIVPVHSKLIEEGFLEYCESVQHERLWPELEKGANGYSHQWGKWFQQVNRRHITQDKRKVFHSTRKNFANGLKQASVSMEIIEELCGHATASISSRVYGRRYNPQVLKEAVEKLQYAL